VFWKAVVTAMVDKKAVVTAVCWKTVVTVMFDKNAVVTAVCWKAVVTAVSLVRAREMRLSPLC
jgi:hypothetical protein